MSLHPRPGTRHPKAALRHVPQVRYWRHRAPGCLGRARPSTKKRKPLGRMAIDDRESEGGLADVEFERQPNCKIKHPQERRRAVAALDHIKVSRQNALTKPSHQRGGEGRCNRLPGAVPKRAEASTASVSTKPKSILKVAK